MTTPVTPGGKAKHSNSCRDPNEIVLDLDDDDDDFSCPVSNRYDVLFDAPSEKEDNGTEMRFPDTTLRQIFSYLEFSDIASCRLVSKQWHRFALDGFSFVLNLRHAVANQKEAPGDRLSDNKLLKRFISDPVNATLSPYPASLDWKAGEKKALEHAGNGQSSAKMRLDQVAGFIRNNFERKIKHIVVKNKKAGILAILPKLVTMAPAAATICAVDQGKTTRFIRQRQTDDFRCLELDMKSVFIRESAAGFRLLSDNAGFIVRLSAEDWWSVETAINEAEKHDGSRLVLVDCEELLIADSSLDAQGPSVRAFSSIAEHFPAVRKLEYTIGQDEQIADFARLEQLANLNSLIMHNKSNGQMKQLPKLSLPNLVDLHLGNNILLPKDQENLFLPALTTLELDAGHPNALRLSEFGVPILANLTALTTTKLQTEHVKPFLRSILPVSPKMERLTIDLMLLNHLGRPVLTDIYDTLLVVPVCKAAVTVGTFHIFPNAVDCRDLVRQRVADIKQRSLKTAITVAFKDNANNALVNTLSIAGAGGQGVIISATTNDAEADNCKSYELTWHNNVAGIQQKLKIRVST